MVDGSYVITSLQLHTLCNIVEAAGREIMSVYASGGQVWQKNDASPLTEADLRADSVIRCGLESYFPGLFILSEESVSMHKSHVSRFFLVDPLDGTKEFLKRNDEFTVNIALIHEGVPIAAVVLAPALDTLYFAAVGFGAYKRNADGTHRITTHVSQSQPLRILGSRSHGGDKLSVWLETLLVPHTFVAVGSSLKFCHIAEGQADIYPRFGPTSQWDTAAAQCVLEVAGGAVLDLSGQTLRYGLDCPILNPEFVAVGNQSLIELI
jgi:3'(2'),5'-bisphosphate nucleotidase